MSVFCYMLLQCVFLSFHLRKQKTERHKLKSASGYVILSFHAIMVIVVDPLLFFVIFLQY